MEHPVFELIAQYGIYAVFVLCTVEGDITLLISGVLAHSGFFGDYSLLKVMIFGTAGGVTGDSIGYLIGRIFHQNAKHYRFYQVAQPRVEKLMKKFGGSAIIISKYIYGIRVAVCLSYGVAKMPFLRFLMLSTVSCFLWVLLLAGTGYFFSGAITSIIGDFHQIGIALFFIVMIGIVGFYILERYWLSERVEDANPETLHRIEETIIAVEEAAQEKFHDLSEKLHLTREPSRDQKDEKQIEQPVEEEKIGSKTASKSN
jgi:membrane protein DedA with SNARE-associated domain